VYHIISLDDLTLGVFLEARPTEGKRPVVCICTKGLRAGRAA
jgi:diadenosine tetraphosphate (Ap4A) HIT family hydrolase